MALYLLLGDRSMLAGHYTSAGKGSEDVFIVLSDHIFIAEVGDSLTPIVWKRFGLWPPTPSNNLLSLPLLLLLLSLLLL